MKRGSMIVKVGMLLLTPAVLAFDFWNYPFQFGGELRRQKVNVAWHTVTTSQDQHLDMLTTAITNASAYTYQEAGDKLNNLTYSGRGMFRAYLTKEYSIMFALGIESGMDNANGYRPLDIGAVTGGGTVSTANWNLMDTTSCIWKSKKVFSPAVFFGYESMAIGMEYEMREYEISGHISTLTTYLDKKVKDHQFLFGLRGEQVVEIADREIVLSCEYMTNLGRESGKEMATYFRDLAKYGVDANLTDLGSSLIIDSGIMSASVKAAPDSRASVSRVNTNIGKASLGIGILFRER